MSTGKTCITSTRTDLAPAPTRFRFSPQHVQTQLRGINYLGH